MSASRMKNLILLILTLCALGLLCIVVPNRLAQTHEQRQMLQELKTLYESYGLSVLLDELPRSPRMREFREVIFLPASSSETMKFSKTS